MKTSNLGSKIFYKTTSLMYNGKCKMSGEILANMEGLETMIIYELMKMITSKFCMCLEVYHKFSISSYQYFQHL